MIIYGEVTHWQGNDEAEKFFALLTPGTMTTESVEAAVEFAAQWDYGDNYGFTHTAAEIGLDNPAVRFVENDTTMIVYHWGLTSVDIYGKIEEPE